MRTGSKYSLYPLILKWNYGRQQLKDGLKWEYHVSDLNKWQNEAAAMYGVNSIPMSFLIDENGIIVAKDLRGFDLHANIDKHVKSLR